MTVVACPGEIVRAVLAALADPAGVTAHRPGALERAGLALAGWHDTRQRLAATETCLVAVLDQLGQTGLVTTIAGLTAVGAAAILAKSGDPARFATPRSLAGHAGLCPPDNASGAFQGKTPISGRGRPGLRVAAWRAVWAAMPDNPVLAAKFTSLTTRDQNRLARQQARTACAAALLRWIHPVITRRVSGDPAIAAATPPLPRAARPDHSRCGNRRSGHRPGRGKPEPPSRNPTSRMSTGSPARLGTRLLLVPVTFTTGVWPRHPQVRRFGGLKP